MLFFDQASAAAGKFEIVSSAYRLRQSQCYLQSKGALTCLKCHDPHDIPHGPDAAPHYDAVCRQCHAAAFDTLVASGGHSTAINCGSCHKIGDRGTSVGPDLSTIGKLRVREDLLESILEPSRRIEQKRVIESWTVPPSVAPISIQSRPGR